MGIGRPKGSTPWEEALGIDKVSLAQEALEKEALAREEEAVLDATDTFSVELQQVVDGCKSNLDFLAAVAMPVVFQYSFPPLILVAWQLMLDAALKQRDFTQLALGIPRGFAKTTLVKLFILWCVLFSNKKFIIVISSTSAKAEAIIADVIDMMNETNIVNCFGDWRIGIEKDTQELKKFVFRGRTVMLQAIGAQGSIRGTNVKQERPDVMIFEDVQDAEVADSKVQSEALERWMVGTAMKAKSPHGCFYLYVGNMFPTPYSILRKLKNNPRWIKFICGGILADGSSLWEELQPIEQLLNELENDISMGREEIFAAEVLNDENAKLHTRADLANLRDWPLTELHKPQGKFIVIDPANKKPNSDNITIGQFDVYDAVPALMHLDEGQYSPGDTIKRALLMALKTNTRMIGVESTAYQASLLYWFEFICKQLGIDGMEFVELHTQSFSKAKRITDAVKMMSSKEILLHPRVKDSVIGQLVSWNPIKRDNTDGILDVVAYAPQMIEKYGHLCTIEGEILAQEYEAHGVVPLSQNCYF